MRMSWSTGVLGLMAATPGLLIASFAGWDSPHRMALLACAGAAAAAAAGGGAWLGLHLSRRLDRMIRRLPSPIAEAGGDGLHGLEAAVGRAEAAIGAQSARQGEVGAKLSAMRESSLTLAATSIELMHSAEHTTDEAQRAAAGAEQVSANASTIAASAEEMTAAIREIANTTTEAARTSADAAARSREVDAAVRRLGESSSDIDHVVKTISGIAAQTNLLSLNATIEAARAGEAGRGFAVVAGEVRLLARKTAEATGDIARRISAIQEDSRRATVTIADINRLIERIDELQQTVASAVEEQSATVSEMSRNIGDSAKGVADIARAIAAVAAAARTASGGAIAVKELGEEMSEGTEDLNRITRDPAQEAGRDGLAADAGLDPIAADRMMKAHIALRTHLLAAINGGEPPERRAACDHDACELGRWLHGSHGPGSEAAIAQLRTTHASFHAEVGRAIDLIASKRFEDAKELIHGGIRAGSSAIITDLARLRAPGASSGSGTRAKAGRLLVWDQRYATGIGEIDRQHQELFKHTAELHHAMVEGRGRQVIGEKVTFLATYAQEHFALEERLMTQAGYPGLAKHQELHRTLVGQVSGLLQRFTAGETLKTMEVSEFLASWLRHHILDVDHAYVDSLTAAGLAR